MDDYRVYRVYVYKSLNPIPEVFKVAFEEEMTLKELNDRILTALDGNAINFTTTKGVSRFYDRCSITKIRVKEI